ncbi:MAG: phosphoglucosamine mutase [Flavobacteriaceae bacterium]|nr:MAG: phosphoglucosamine mutase [Bacteroidota bacterium]
MPLIKSISGIRGTIGDRKGEDLTKDDIILYTKSFVLWLESENRLINNKIVVGRDARVSGKMIEELVINTLTKMGLNVVCLGLSTTPTVEIAVPLEEADAGIIITASHNPRNWNALKLLNNNGEFISANDGEKLLNIANSNPNYNTDLKKGFVKFNSDYIDIHTDMILNLPNVEVDLIKKRKFKIVVDAVNSTGGIAVPNLLKKLDVNVVELYCEPNGEFPHNPEPLKENLTDLSNLVIKQKADLGIVVDPDVDRLAFVSENGEVFGEEYTLVACSDYYLQNKPGNTVSNLSSSRALRDITELNNCNHFFSAVGEVNVVEMMKNKNAVIGGEGNGGIILPELHYGRDALVGIALFLSHLSRLNISCSRLRSNYPNYFMSKDKVKLNDNLDVESIIKNIALAYSSEKTNIIDGLKIDFDDSWVQLRKSNTEPIIRVYSEAKSQEEAEKLSKKFISEIKKFS